MLTQEMLKRVVDYDPVIGRMTWKGSSVEIGCDSGHGYRKACIKRRRYYVHRLVWLYVHGRWPEHQIDHINRNRSDNRLANLREATQQQQHLNSAKQLGRSGIRGVHKHGRKWRAKIQIARRWKLLGSFDTLEEADAVYRAAIREHFGEFVPGDINEA